MPPKPITEPMDRSNSPATISSAAPTAITPRNAATVPQLTMPSAENMPEPPAAKANTRKTSTVPDSAPDSGRPRRRRHSPTLRTRSSRAAAGEGATSGAAVVAGGVVISGCLRSTVLAGVLLDLADVVLGHEARAGQDVARAVDRLQAV